MAANKKDVIGWIKPIGTRTVLRTCLIATPVVGAFTFNSFLENRLYDVEKNPAEIPPGSEGILADWEEIKKGSTELEGPFFIFQDVLSFEVRDQVKNLLSFDLDLNWPSVEWGQDKENGMDEASSELYLVEFTPLLPQNTYKAAICSQE